MFKKINLLECLRQWHYTSAYFKTTINHSTGIVISYINRLKTIIFNSRFLKTAVLRRNCYLQLELLKALWLSVEIYRKVVIASKWSCIKTEDLFRIYWRMLSFTHFSLGQERKDQRFLPGISVLPKHCGQSKIQAMVQSEHNLYFALGETRKQESSHIHDLPALYPLQRGDLSEERDSSVLLA